MDHFTYILTPYKPNREIKEDDLTSYQILLELSKQEYFKLPTLNQKIINSIGFNNIVYGIQKDIESNNIDLEYYFYTHAPIWNENPNIALNTVLEIFKEELDEQFQLNIPNNFNLGMFSIDIPKNEEKIKNLDIYDMQRAFGTCYRVNDKGIFKKNIYNFYYDSINLEQALAERNIPASCLIFGNYGIWYESVCISLKRNEYWSIYYSKVEIKTLILFLKRLNYPNHIIKYFETRRPFFRLSNKTN